MGNATSKHSVRRSLAFSALALALTACSAIGVATERDPGADFAAFETYAWSSGGPPVAPEGAGDEPLAERIRRAVDGELSSRGLRRAAEADASLVVVQHAEVEVRTKRNDPYYAVYPVELVEEGTLRIELFDAATGERVWRGSARRRLRVVARGMGLNRLDTVSTSEQRSWPVEEMVAAILARCPLSRARDARAAPDAAE